METHKTVNLPKNTAKQGTAKNFLKVENKCPLFIGHTEIGASILAFFDGTLFSILITIVTIITLFSDDVRQIAFDPDSDIPFSFLTVGCMTIYTIEMIALSLTKDGYFLRFYFWLDLISTLTMLLDLTWITQLISGGQGIEAAASIAKIARASRASKIGAKSTKLIRMLRLIRVLRLYKTASNRMNKENEDKIKEEKNKDFISKIKISDPTHQMRKNSRLEKIQQAVSSGAIGQQQKSFKEKKDHNEVSLKNIAFEGSARKLSILHPSRNQSQRHPSAMMKLNEFGSGGKIPSGKNVPNSGGKIPSYQNVDYPQEKGNSNEHFVSAQQIQNQGPQQGEETTSQIDFPVQTKVGNKLNDEIQKNIILMILLILISIPILNGDTWFDNITSYEKGIQELSFFANTDYFDIEAAIYITEMLNLPEPLVYFQVAVNTTCCQFPRDYPEYGDITSLQSLRTDEVMVYLSSVNDTVIFNTKPTNVLSAQLNIGRTLFVCILLIIVTLLFSRDLQIHALEPLQNMIETVKRISNHPLQAMKHIQKQMMIKQSLQKNPENNNMSEEDLLLISEENENNKTQPAILQNLIIKISSLLAVGFGQAGTDLIARNIENCGKLNVMIPGKKIMGIFGFCDIRNFTDATEVLEAKVMVFVNQIAEICHKVVNRVGGNPNKNIGDAFLLVWKFQDDDTVNVQNRHETSLELRSTLKVRQTADLAVYSFVKMVAEITRSRELQKYRQNKGLKERIKDFKGVKMGFGLHVGWAIQGPIGSEFKIDASYLGPHVNMASRLQGATKEYGTGILITGDLYSLMTPKVKEYLRQIDRVQVKADQKPMDLFTVDISPDALLDTRGIHKNENKSTFERKKEKVYFSHERDILLEEIQKKRITSTIWKDDQDITAMRQPFAKFFFEEWKKGFEFFQKGEWEPALQIFKKTEVLGLNHKDGPSSNLIKYITEHNMTPPEHWTGVRQFCG